MFFQEPSFLDNLSETFNHIFVETNLVLDHIVACAVVYLALWQLFKVMKDIEKKNRELRTMFKANKAKQDNLILIKDKQREYEDVVVKARAAQKETAKQLDDEVKKLIDELMTATARLTELEECMKKSKPAGTSGKYLRVGDGAAMPDEYSEGPRIVEVDSFEEYKILDPSFPPRVLPDPPPRKYGVFVSRPFSKQRGPSTTATPAKIGFK